MRLGNAPVPDSVAQPASITDFAQITLRSQESGVRSQESGVRSQESGVRSQEQEQTIRPS